MRVIGYKKGKMRVITTNDPAILEAFANMMDRTEYITTEE